MSTVIGRLTPNGDAFNGTDANETIQVPSSNTNLRSSDALNGGGGFDTLLFERTAELGVNAANLGGIDRIEEFDMTASSSVAVTLSTSTILQSDTNSLRLTFDGDPMTLDMRTVDPTTGAFVEINGTGQVTLNDGPQLIKVVTTTSSNIIGGEGRDSIEGGSGRDSFQGGLGDDSLSGGDNADSLSGGAEQDRLFGEGGNDTLDGGDGHDVISGGGGLNTATGGTGADIFLVSPTEVLTITDFDTPNPQERIDLRALSGSYGFSDLGLIQNGANVEVTIPGHASSVILNGVTVGALSATDFVFPGETLVTMAEGLSRTADFEFTDGADAFVGGAGDQIFEVKGNFGKLAANDTFDGGAGEGDVLRIWGEDRALSEARIPGMDGVEVIDMSGATGSLEAQVTQAMVDKSDSGKITIRHGDNDLTVLTGDVADANDVVVEGSGIVTLRDVDGQGVRVSDYYDGHVIGQNKNDSIIGGALNDRLEGSGGDDSLDGGSGGNDLLLGQDGNDVLTSKGGADTMTGGEGVDRFVVLAADAAGYDVTITDFAGAANFESIDVRDWNVTQADLSFVQSGSETEVRANGRTIVTLENVQSGSLGGRDFIVTGEAAPQQFVLSSGADNITGGDANDLIDLIGQSSQLDTSVDTINGGGGFDTLRVFGSDRSLGPARLEALTSVEAIDLTAASGSHDIAVNAELAAQSDTGSLLIKFGDATLSVNSGGVMDPSSLVLEGTGPVTLSSGTLGQQVKISDAFGGDVTAGNDATIIVGGAKGDTINGDFGDDTLSGGGGGDSLSGGEGNDVLRGGAGSDTLRGGEGNDRLIADGGADTLDGGSGFDQYVILAGAEGTVFEQFDPGNFVQRIDLTALTALENIGDLTITQEGSDARVTGSGLDLVFRDVSAGDLGADNFLFDGQDPLLYQVTAGTSNSQLQDLFDGAPEGAVIEIEAGRYSITEGLVINRGDITVKGAGEGETIFVTNIPNNNPAPTILVQPEDLADRFGTLDEDAVEGTTRIKLPDYDALRAADPTQDFEAFQVGDLVHIQQPNDPDFIRESGNSNWNEPETDNELDAETYYLREHRSRIVSIDEDGYATLAEAVPYTFAAGSAQILKNSFLANVTLSDFSIEGNFGDDPDPFFFDDTIPEWVSIAALEFDGVRDSHLENISITNPAAHAFKWQRAHETTADNLSAEGAHNKSGSSGYHYLLQESFANDFTNLSSVASRHAVLFSSFSAEHYNNLHLTFTDRDINFHGSADDENTIVVDELVQNYPLGITDDTPQWQAVHPGVQGLHPESDIEGNDVTFKKAYSGERSDRIVTHVDGAEVRANVGSDEVIGQGGNDTISGGEGNDSLKGGGGNDILNGNDGKDTLEGGDGNDILRGGEGNDVIRGGAGNDTLTGGSNGDNLFGGAGQDLFLRSYTDFSDIYFDFEAGADGDVMQIRGSAYTQFSQLLLRQVGDDTILDFGPTGATTFRNVQVGDLTAANFQFVTDDTAGQEFSLRADEFRAVGTARSDTFNVSRAHMDSAEFAVVAGGGYDRVVISQSTLNANLGETGTYFGVEEFDVSGVNRLGLTVENPLVSQSSSGKLYLAIGDEGIPVQLDIGPLGRGKNVFIDGAREVQLVGGREHTVKSNDDVGVNIIGDDLRDVIFGGRASDNINGGAGNDVIFGAGGEDTLHGGAGNDTINGGPGSDTIYVTEAGDRVAESRRWEGEDHVIASVDFRMGSAHIETLELVGGATLGAGNGLRNTITGNDGNNILDGGKNVDTLIGGEGNDTYLIRAPGDNAVELAGEGIDTVRAFRAHTLEAHVENLQLQTLRNAAGEGVAGINGFGNNLDNVIIGNPFDNVIGGKGGQDTLRGQAGADRFVFDTSLGNANVDRVVDFSRAEGDTIGLDNAIFTQLANGRLAAGNFVEGTAATTANHHVIFDEASGRLWYDANGAARGGQQLVATFDGDITLAASDFLIL